MKNSYKLKFLALTLVFALFAGLTAVFTVAPSVAPPFDAGRTELVSAAEDLTVDYTYYLSDGPETEWSYRTTVNGEWSVAEVAEVVSLINSHAEKAVELIFVPNAGNTFDAGFGIEFSSRGRFMLKGLTTLTGVTASGGESVFTVSKNTTVYSSLSSVSHSVESIPAVLNYGSFFITRGVISASSGTAVYCDGGMVSISGGTVSATSGTAILNVGTGNITMTNGTVSAATGTAIEITGASVLGLSGGTVSAATGIAVRVGGRGSITLLGSAAITSANPNADEGTIVFSGGRTGSTALTASGQATFKNTAAGGESNVILNNGASGIAISGGGVIAASAGKGHGIHSTGTGGITVSGTAVVSAFGGAAIFLDSDASDAVGNLTVTDNAVVSATTGTAIMNEGGNAVITNAALSATTGTVIFNGIGSVTKVSGCSISSEGEFAVYNGGEIEIRDCTVEDAESGIHSDGGKVSIYDSVITVTEYGIFGYAAQIYVYGGKITAVDCGIYDEGGYIYVYGGEINAYDYGIYGDVMSKDNENYAAGTVRICGGSRITAEYCAVYIDEGLLYIYDSVIIGSDYAVSGDGSQIYIDGSEINGSGYAIYSENGNVTIVGSDVTADGNAIYADSDVNIEGGSISSDGEYAIRSENGIVTLTENKVTAAGNAIYADGDINIVGGTISSDGAYAVHSESGRVNITDSKVAAAGNAIYAYGDVEIFGTISSEGAYAIYSESGNVTVTGGKVTASDVAIHSESGSVTITDSKVTSTGNAIYADGEVNIAGGTISSEGAYAIHSESGNVTITGSKVTATGNEIASVAIEIGTGDLTIMDSTVSVAIGAAIEIGTGDLTITDSTVSASIIAIEIDSGNVTVTGSIVSGAAGIAVGNGDVTVSDSTVTATTGAAIKVGTGNVTVESGTVSGTRETGIAILLLYTGEVTLTGGIISGGSYAVYFENILTESLLLTLGNATVTGTVRMGRPSTQRALSNDFESSKSRITTFEIVGARLGDVLYTGGGAYFASFALTGTSYDLGIINGNIVICTAITVALVGVTGKTYDGTNDAAGHYSLSFSDGGAHTGEYEIWSGAVYSDQNAGLGRTVTVKLKTVSLSVFAFVGADADGVLTITAGNAEILRKEISFTLSGLDKLYDGTANAEYTKHYTFVFAGLIDGEDLVYGTDFSVGFAAYGAKAESLTTITVSGVALKTVGTAANYYLGNTSEESELVWIRPNPIPTAPEEPPIQSAKLLRIILISAAGAAVLLWLIIYLTVKLKRRANSKALKPAAVRY